MWNRLTTIFAVYAITLACLVFNSVNPYLSGMVIYCGFMAAILSCGYVLESEKQTTGEKWLINLFQRFVSIS